MSAEKTKTVRYVVEHQFPEWRKDDWARSAVPSEGRYAKAQQHLRELRAWMPARNFRIVRVTETREVVR